MKFKPGDKVKATYQQWNYYTRLREVVVQEGKLTRWHHPKDTFGRPSGPEVCATGQRPLEVLDRNGRSHWIAVRDHELELLQ